MSSFSPNNGEILQCSANFCNFKTVPNMKGSFFGTNKGLWVHGVPARNAALMSANGSEHFRVAALIFNAVFFDFAM